jgi:uncharacterized protein YukE
MTELQINKFLELLERISDALETLNTEVAQTREQLRFK